MNKPKLKKQRAHIYKSGGRWIVRHCGYGLYNELAMMWLHERIKAGALP